VKEVELKYKVKRIKFTINEADLREAFIKGFGPGGQKTNKANNCVVLKHLPTGLVVRCHDSRDQLINRKIARKLLYDKLDVEVNGENSKIVMRDARRARTKDR
jgi:protein subunit release factor B